MLINDSAIGTDQSVRYVLVVGADNKVEYRPVQLGPVIDGLRVVQSGLVPGETIVVNGLQRVRAGAQVQPQRVAMGERRSRGGSHLAGRQRQCGAPWRNALMKLSDFFIERPIFAGVISAFITIAGLIALFKLPISEYPEVVPPSVVVHASYPGANPKVIADTVAAPLEQAIVGVEDMLYMSSTSTMDGSLTLTVTFRIGADIDRAQVQVQNRVSQALPRLPEEVRNLGVNTVKASSNLTLRRQPDLPERTLRRTLPAQLRGAERQGRAGAAAGHGRRAGLRWRRLLDAGMARSAEARRAQPDRGRRRGGDPRAERAGGRRTAGRAALERHRVSDRAQRGRAA